MTITIQTEEPKPKLRLWDEHLLTITIVLGLRFYDFVRKEWKEYRGLGK